ncbi:esterase-like activity of phytase family protein [Chelativorans sp. YIM 93263]|uniref:esterase-like activity of phytase family protein n=1 Tax=Chelativorans sp. YIM 93263 TaxID=2906648 RepID=UPI002379AA2A|nr:esterase-like activity of phytase family protein [Chelativorans sp. YIM 93263]
MAAIVGACAVRADISAPAAWVAGLFLVFIFGFSASAVPEEDGTTTVSSSRITDFEIGSRDTRFGPLTFVGGLEMRSRDRRFGGLSSFRFLSPGDRFIGVTDTGFWFFGRLERDGEGRPSGFTDFTMAPIHDPDGNIVDDKWTTDAEAIAVRGGEVAVGFERVHRIAVFEFDPPDMGPAKLELDFLVPEYELRVNQGFETIAYAPEDSPLAGALVAITERSIDLQENIFAAILSGPRKGIFTVVRSDEFDITDGAFLPDGDLLLLERRFSLFNGGVAMRLRRIDGDDIKPGAAIDGTVLMQADMDYEVDNMEALDIWENADGQTMISLLSDDNHSFLQRNLYLEFRLDDQADTP